MDKELTVYQKAAIGWFEEHPKIKRVGLFDSEMSIWSPNINNLLGRIIKDHPEEAKLFCEAMHLNVDEPKEEGSNER